MAEQDEFEKTLETEIEIQQGMGRAGKPRHLDYALAFKQSLAWYQDFRKKYPLRKSFPRQDSTHAQMLDVLKAANKMGCYDAADLISKIMIKTEGEQ